MKINNNIRKIVILLITICAFSSAIFASGNVKYVTQDNVFITAKASVTSKQIQKVSYGTAVVVISEKGKWCKVELASDSSVKGWIPTMELTSKKISAKNTASSANAREVALAGKGLSEEIEEYYVKEYNVDFTDVDKMEKSIPSIDSTVKFIKEGGLKLEEDDE